MGATVSVGGIDGGGLCGLMFLEPLWRRMSGLWRCQVGERMDLTLSMNVGPMSLRWTCTEPSSFDMKIIDEWRTMATASSNSIMAWMWLTGMEWNGDEDSMEFMTRWSPSISMAVSMGTFSNNKGMNL